MSFPRRIGVRFSSDFVSKYHLTGLQAKWQAFEDENFTKSLGKDFYHEDLITREGWAKYYFKGIFPNLISYIRLQIVNPESNMLVRQFYFMFQKSYQMSLDGKYYISDPVLNKKIIKNGILTELIPKVIMDENNNKRTVYKPGRYTFTQKKIKDVSSANRAKENVKVNTIIRTMVRYSEKPKIVFLVTPPHLIGLRIDKCQFICYN